jgi:hypothetical protein
MSTDSAPHPLQYLLQPAPQPALNGNGRTAAGTGGGRGAFAIRLPAAAQLLLSKTTQSLAIGGVCRHRLLFAATACLFGIIVPTEIAYEGELWVSRTIAGVPQHYILTSLVMLLSFASDGRYLQHLLGRPAVLFYVVCLLMVVAVGFLRNGGNRYLIFADLYTIRWFFVGFMLMRLAIASGSMRQYLVTATITTVATAMWISDRNTMGGQIDTSLLRSSSNDLWPVMNLGTIMVGLLVTVTWPRGILNVVFCSSAFSLLILLGGIKTSTRSLFIFQTLCFLLCLLALSRDPRMRGRSQELRKVFLVFVLMAAPLLTYLVVTGKILGGVTQLGARFTAESAARANTGAARLAEAADMLEKLAPEEWLFGMGVGGMFFNTLGYWASSPHIAVLGWLQKGGLFIFLVVLWTLYFAPATSFFKVVTLPRRDSPVPAPILIVGPPLLAWACLTFLSGGLDIGSFLGLGGLAAIWMQLADDERRFTAARAALAAGR